MRRCLVLANQTLGGERLEQEVQQRIAREEHEFYVVVPATPLREQVVGTGGRHLQAWPSAHERGFALAQQRLDTALEQISALGATVDGEVGDADALEAVRLALPRFPADDIIVSTLPSGVSRWLHADVPSRVARTFKLPVTHLTDDAAPH